MQILIITQITSHTFSSSYTLTEGMTDELMLSPVRFQIEPWYVEYRYNDSPVSDARESGERWNHWQTRVTNRKKKGGFGGNQRWQRTGVLVQSDQTVYGGSFLVAFVPSSRSGVLL